MNQETTSGEFMKQFTGSAAANIVFVVFGLLAMVIKRACDRNTKCKSKCHTCCLDFELSDRTLRSTAPPINLTQV